MSQAISKSASNSKLKYTTKKATLKQSLQLNTKKFCINDVKNKKNEDVEEEVVGQEKEEEDNEEGDDDRK